jgi:hypothetical protein
MALVYDPRYHTWDSWASLMVEGYAAQQLEIPGAESEWRSWAAGFKGIDVFSKDAVPDPYAFEDWKDWAAQLVNTLSTSAK